MSRMANQLTLPPGATGTREAARVGSHPETTLMPILSMSRRGKCDLITDTVFLRNFMVDLFQSPHEQLERAHQLRS